MEDNDLDDVRYNERNARERRAEKLVAKIVEKMGLELMYARDPIEVSEEFQHIEIRLSDNGMSLDSLLPFKTFGEVSISIAQVSLGSRGLLILIENADIQKLYGNPEF